MTKKVICINPPPGSTYGKTSRDGRCQSEEGTWTETFPPVTLASIAGHVRAGGHEVTLIDCIGSDITWEGLEARMREIKPDAVIINTITPTIQEDLSTAELAKKINPACITAAYGTMPTALPADVMKMQPALDVCLRGDPETPALLAVNGEPQPPGIWVEPDLDALAMPAYELLPDYRFPLNNRRWTFIIDGKGCPYKCIYCVEPVVSDHRARYKSVKRTVDEIEFAVDRLGMTFFMFWDELFTLNFERSTEVCKEIIKRGLNKRCQWMLTTRVDRADKELFALMKEAGCWMMVFGIESGNQGVLDRVRKGITLEQSRNAVTTAAAIGLRTVGHFIIGLPGSSPATEEDTIKFAKSLPLDFAQFYCCTAFPGSELYDWAVNEKLITVDSWAGVEQGTANIGYPDFSAEEIQKIKRRAYNEFYFRPVFWWRFFNSFSVSALPYLFARGMRFLKWMLK